MKTNYCILRLSGVCLTTVALLLTSCGTKEFSITSNGENLSTLTKVTDGEDECSTPFGGDDGKNLFFSVHDGPNRRNIYKKENAFSASMNQKTSGENLNMCPTYSEENKKLAFSGQFQGADFADIYMMNDAQGKAMIQVTNTPDAEEQYPCFSPDGKYIVYDKRPGRLDWSNAEIWMKNIETGENTMLGKGRMPSFSPDGKSIVFVRYTTDKDYTCLWSMGIDGDNQMQLTDAKLGAVWHPRYSPNGERIVFDCYKKKKDDVDIYIIDKDGNNLTQLTINQSYDGQPYWTKDGYIYFVSDRGGKKENYQIWRFKW